MRICDVEMYDYFEKLLYQEGKLPEEWKTESALEEYGLTDYDLYSLMGARELFYDPEDAKKQLYLLETMQKFLHEYIGIEGLEELFINNYAVIENSIFLEHDNLGNPVHIREHAKHQMKNAFLGSKLILEYGYLDDMAENVYEKAGAVTRYLALQAEQVLLESESEKGKTQERGRYTEEWRTLVVNKLKEWSYKIFMISSILHDIGYPLEFYLRSAQKLTDYPPYLKILSPTVKNDFSEVKALLMGSWLFKLIDNQRIKAKYEKNDHGVLSAVSLLMHFYYGGRIYSLTREKRCILEMAAIAIYRHTDKFENGFRMVYLQDPISYMVRLCDDLQEWDRFKLLINDKHNYLRCEKCWNILQEENRVYTCSKCGSKYRKITQIKNRKVNYISLCDELLLKMENGKVIIEVPFDLMKQVEILLDDYSGILRREKDLKKVQKYVQNQALSPGMEIRFFASNNPICLIDRMIKEAGCTEDEILGWICKQKGIKRKENLEAFYQDYLMKTIKNPFGKEIEINELRYKDVVSNYVRKYYGEIYSLYEMLKDFKNSKTA